MPESLVFLCQMIEYVITGEIATNKNLIVSQELQTGDKPSLTMLPPDVLCFLTLYLTPKDIVSLAQTCKAVNTLFNSENRSVFDANRLLTYVVNGEQGQVEKLLSACSPERCQRLLQTKINFNAAGRSLAGMSAFQYALWSRDWQMYTVLSKFISADIAAQQLLDLESTVFGRHGFSLQPLIAAYSDFMGIFYAGRSSNETYEYHMYAIGKEQRLVPAHILQHYMQPEGSWEITPDFLKTHELTRCSLAAHSAQLSQLGVSHVLARGCYSAAQFAPESFGLISDNFFYKDDLWRKLHNFYRYNAYFDKPALTALEQAATTKYAEFRKELLSVTSLTYKTNELTIAEESDARRAARPV